MEESSGFFYRCSFENPFDKTQNGCAYLDETKSNYICITRSSEKRVTTINLGIIEETDSMCSAPVVLINKKTRQFETWIREFNKVTVFDQRPMPRIDDILINITKATFISKLDLT